MHLDMQRALSLYDNELSISVTHYLSAKVFNTIMYNSSKCIIILHEFNGVLHMII